VFVPTQLVNFALVPPHLRFVFVGVVSLFWSARSLLPPVPRGLILTCSLRRQIRI
jgi:hypothetical protein